MPKEIMTAMMARVALTRSPLMDMSSLGQGALIRSTQSPLKMQRPRIANPSASPQDIT